MVAAIRDDCAAGRECGSAYVFRCDGSTWVEEQKLTASDAGVINSFGSSVFVRGDMALVGAYGDDCPDGWGCGSAYVFRFNGTSWVEEQKLTASDGTFNDKFGASVSLDGDTIAVGAHGHRCAAGGECGAVYVFRFNGSSWVEEQKVIASDAGWADLFGSPVLLAGNVMVIGAIGDDCMGLPESDCGSAYVFRFNGTSWNEEQKLIASDAPYYGAVFGGSVSLSGDTLVVGANGRSSAYVFRFNGTSWIEAQKLTPSDATFRAHFGTRLSVGGDSLVVGAPSADCAGGSACGAAYVFRLDNGSWVEKQKLTASDAADGNSFGRSVSLSGDTVIAGTPSDDCVAGTDCGAAYVFSCAFEPTVVNLEIKPGGCPNAVNPKSKGVLPVALVGSPGFDVAMVNTESLTLARADGVGESVSPLSGRRGLRMAIEDVATPFDGETCNCHDLGGDGIDDLSIKFSTPELTRAFALDAWPPGETIELVLRGSLQDGTTFEASDCILMPGSLGPRDDLHRRNRSSRPRSGTPLRPTD